MTAKNLWIILCMYVITWRIKCFQSLFYALICAIKLLWLVVVLLFIHLAHSKVVDNVKNHDVQCNINLCHLNFNFLLFPHFCTEFHDTLLLSSFYKVHCYGENMNDNKTCQSALRENMCNLNIFVRKNVRRANDSIITVLLLLKSIFILSTDYAILCFFITIE